MTFFNGGTYDCYQRFVWHNQGKGSWCARDWYRSCMHAGLINEVNPDGSTWVKDPNGPEGGDNRVESGQNGWVTGYTYRDKGRVAPQKLYVSGGQIIVEPYVCRGYLKTSPDDPGQRIQSNDARAQEYFPAPTLAEIRRYVSSGACVGCPGRGNLMGNGC
ncbi:MAG: hypothetical protein OXC63_03470 [Aestuariivita sp.]|nr:hypothetical protein [Aestuariivita sp.]MCY4346421.1 hypothetical protein [Aestuariivita sp.]